MLFTKDILSVPANKNRNLFCGCGSQLPGSSQNSMDFRNTFTFFFQKAWQ